MMAWVYCWLTLGTGDLGFQSSYRMLKFDSRSCRHAANQPSLSSAAGGVDNLNVIAKQLSFVST